MPEPLTRERALEVLRTVHDPEFHKDLVTLNMIKNLEVEGGKVSFTVNLTTPACPLKSEIERSVRQAFEGLAGLTELQVDFASEVRQPVKQPIPGIKNVLAVGSGKGGVGKSTVAVNFAAALVADGARVGLLDADVYGPSQAKLLGVDAQLRAGPEGKILPNEAHGLRFVSMANLAKRDQALVWRGPMLHGVIRQFLLDVTWGELDYLVIDLPPGTGDVPLSLSQLVPVTGGVVVCTPQEVALIDARRAIDMFKKQNVEVLGIVENMAYFECRGCGSVHHIFGNGGARRLAEEWGLPFLGEIPIGTDVTESGENGQPIVISHPESPQAKALAQAARVLAGRVSVQTFKAAELA